MVPSCSTCEGDRVEVSVEVSVEVNVVQHHVVELRAHGAADLATLPGSAVRGGQHDDAGQVPVGVRVAEHHVPVTVSVDVIGIHVYVPTNTGGLRDPGRLPLQPRARVAADGRPVV